MKVCTEVVSTGEPRVCRHCGQVMKGNVTEILGQAQHMTCGRKEGDKGGAFSVPSSPSEAAVQSHSQTVGNNNKVHLRPTQAFLGDELHLILKHAVSFLWTGREPRMTSSDGCFRSNGAELLVSTSYLYRTLHKNGQYSFCKWEKGEERWRYLPMLPGQGRNEFSALFPVHSARAQ